MSKQVLSPEQIQRRKNKEAKELLKWKKVKGKPTGKHYFLILMFALIIIYVIDEISSNINLTMQSSILFDLFHIPSRDASSPEYASAINTLSSFNVMTYLFYFILPFYKALADKFGRKPFLIINTLGMALGMFMVMISTNMGMYFIGVAILAIVTPNDVQTMYILEIAPKQHRAKLCNIAKALAILGISTIGLMRRGFMTEELSSWRAVYVIPVVAALVVAIIGIFLAKETPVFVEGRLAYLESTDEERLAKGAAEKQAQAGGGIGKALKFAFKHKQLKFIVLAGVLYAIATAVINYFESIMAESMRVEQISTAIVFYPLVYAALTFIAGFVSDRWGRKRVSLIFGTIAVASLIGFVLCAKYLQNGAVVGMLYGGFVGGLYSTSDTIIFTMSQESAPTEIRASIVGVMFLFLSFGAIAGMIVFAVLQNFLSLGMTSIILAVPFISISLIILGAKVGETKDVDLATVTGTEWD